MNDPFSTLMMLDSLNALVDGLAIAGAPPFAVFLSEFSIVRAGPAGGRHLAMGLLVAFVAIGFVGILSHVNRMVFGQANGDSAPPIRLLSACIATLGLAGLFVLAFGLYLPEPVHRLLLLGAAALGK